MSRFHPRGGPVRSSAARDAKEVIRRESGALSAVERRAEALISNVQGRKPRDPRPADRRATSPGLLPLLRFRES